MSRSRVGLAVKQALAHLLYAMRLLHLFQLITMRRKAVVLMYHRVLTPEQRRHVASHAALIVERETFAAQMEFLSRRFKVLSLEEFARCLEQRVPFPPGSCLITFDDGWRDNFTNAFPILVAHRLPAAIFLAANYVGSRRVFWQEALTHLLIRAIQRASRDPGMKQILSSHLAPFGLSHVLEWRDEDLRPRLHRAIDAQKLLPRAEVERLVADLAGDLGADLQHLSESDGFIGWDEVETMSREGIAFGGHGVNHLLLTRASATEADEEIRGSRDFLAKLQQPIAAFAYPNGYVNDEVVQRVRAAGYRLAFITRRGLVGSSDDPFTISRLNVHDGATRSVPMFFARVLGLF